MVNCLECGAPATIGEPCPECGRLNLEPSQEPCAAGVPTASLPQGMPAVPNGATAGQSRPHNALRPCQVPPRPRLVKSTRPLSELAATYSAGTAPTTLLRVVPALSDDSEDDDTPLPPALGQQVIRWAAICLLFSFSVSFLIPSCSNLNWHFTSPREQCRLNLISLSAALEAYACSHDRRYPQKLAELCQDFHGNLQEIPACPYTGRQSAGYIYRVSNLPNPAESSFTITCSDSHSSAFSPQAEAPLSYSSRHGFNVR